MTWTERCASGAGGEWSAGARTASGSDVEKIPQNVSPGGVGEGEGPHTLFYEITTKRPAIISEASSRCSHCFYRGIYCYIIATNNVRNGSSLPVFTRHFHYSRQFNVLIVETMCS